MPCIVTCKHTNIVGMRRMSALALSGSSPVNKTDKDLPTPAEEPLHSGMIFGYGISSDRAVYTSGQEQHTSRDKLGDDAPCFLERLQNMSVTGLLHGCADALISKQVQHLVKGITISLEVANPSRI